MEQAGDLGQVTKAGQELVSTIRNLALASEIDRLQESSDRFHEYIEHILEVNNFIYYVQKKISWLKGIFFRFKKILAFNS